MSNEISSDVFGEDYWSEFDARQVEAGAVVEAYSGPYSRSAEHFKALHANLAARMRAQRVESNGPIDPGDASSEVIRH